MMLKAFISQLNQIYKFTSSIPVAIAMVAVLFTGPAWSYEDKPNLLIAKAVLAQGDVTVTRYKLKPMTILTGTRFIEGDLVKTGKDSVLEIKFDTGDLIHLEPETELIVTSIHRDKVGSTFSIFKLITGLVKSSVTKLLTPESKFEYKTKAAITGVGGTPPFIVQINEGATEVDLLPDYEFEGGNMYLQSQGKGKSDEVILEPGFRSSVAKNKTPDAPIVIEADRLKWLESIKMETWDKVRDVPPEPAGPEPVI